MPHPYRARAFGLRWASDTPLPMFVAGADDDGPADVQVSRVASLLPRTGGLPPRTGGETLNGGWINPDGIRFVLGAAAFDMTGGDRITWAAPDVDSPPTGFYSTTTALLLAWRGAVPLHASAVEVDGHGIVLVGPSGAGKSSLARALAAAGGRLISDDLSVLAASAGGSPVLLPGRPAIRLLPNGIDSGPLDAFGKLSVRPAMVPQDRPVIAATMVLMGGASAPVDPAGAIAAVIRQFFRPRWMQALPRSDARMAVVVDAARRLRFLSIPPASQARDSVENRAARLLAMLAAA